MTEHSFRQGGPADLRALKSLGVAAIDLSFPGDDAEAMLSAMRRFADTILTKV